MNRLDPKIVSELFLAACELPPERRSDFLDAACEGDPRLRAEVASLLEHDGDVPDVLEFGVLPGIVPAATEAPIERIGPFRIVEKLAEGGMGVVYRAEQETPIPRPVAIKLIRSGIESRQVIARFESEREALALMNHPNIARVLDAGETVDGRPYFAMDFVDGEPITTFSDARMLGISERLELFVQICAGVQHAHRKAIIHRDIKPSNVLVTVRGGRAVPIIIDFGIAKALDRPVAGRKVTTEMGQLMGTPEYMSPEQAEMSNHNVDTRTDVYSLGALLYELLAGSPPFDPDPAHDDSLSAVLRRIRELDPPLPSVRIASLADPHDVAGGRRLDPGSLARRLRGDLDLIVMKALSKEPEQRYSSPSELANDVTRHLSHEAILAVPPSTSYRAAKFARKHRVAVGLAGLSLAVLIGFAVTMSLQATRVARERDRANEAAMTTERALNLTMGLLERYEPGATGGSRAVDRQMLDPILEQIEQLDGLPLMQGRLFVTTARVYRDFGFHDEARKLLERAQPRLRGAVGERHPDALAATSALAFMDFYQGRHAEAERRFVEALAGQREVLGDEHADTLTTLMNLANLYTALGRYDEAERFHEEALRARRRVHGDDDPQTMKSMISLGILYTRVGRYDEAEPLLVGALDGQRRVLGDDDPETLKTMTSLATLFSYQEALHDEAQRLYRTALEKQRRVLGERHPSTLKTYYNSACLAALQNDRRLALDLLGEAVERGYSNRRLTEDADLAILHGDPEFEALTKLVEQRNAAD